MNRIITIGREFGSGGRELGRRISEKLQIAYYDQEIITEIARRTSTSEEYVRQITESRPIVSFPIHIRQSFYSGTNALYEQSVSIYAEQHKILRELAQKSDCVIVGRCADYILRDMKPLRIFVYADDESKVKRCIERETKTEKLSESQIRKNMAEIDRNRSRYYELASGQKWGAKENYDLMVNTSGIDIKKLSAAFATYLQNEMQEDAEKTDN